MKKEKTVRTYQRRTKSGKVVTVKQHTAKYDAAEALKKASKKEGAGEELDALKKKGKSEKSKVEKPIEDTPDYGFTADEYKAWYHWDQDADPKNKSALKVEKALKKQMGTKAYNKYFDELTDSYSSRGHNKAFKGLGEKFSTGEKATIKSKVREDLPSMKHGGDVEKDAYSHKVATSKLQKEGFKLGKDNLFHHADGRVAKIDQKTGKWVVTSSKETKASKEEPLKVGGTIQMGNSLNLGKGKKETFKVLAVQKTNKQDRELGNTEAAWVQRKDGSVTLALKDSEKGWMYDDTWTDFTDRKHPYAKSLEAAGYSFKKAQGKGGKYWEVSKGKTSKPFKHTDGGTSVEYDAAYATMNKLTLKHGGVPKKDHKDYAKYKEAEKYVNDFKAGKVGGTKKEVSAETRKKTAELASRIAMSGPTKHSKKAEGTAKEEPSGKPRTKSVMTPHGRTTMIARKEIGTIGRTRYYQDSVGNVYKRNNRVGVSGDGMYAKLSGAKAKEILGQLKSSDVAKAGKTTSTKSKSTNKYGGLTKEEFEKRQRDFAKRVKDSDKGTRAKYSFTDIKKKIKGADISDAARKRLLKSINKPYAVVTPAVMEKRLQKELNKKKK